jgi:hypothetical protein
MALSCTSDSHYFILISPFSYVAFHSVVLTPYNLSHRPIIHFASRLGGIASRLCGWLLQSLQPNVRIKSSTEWLKENASTAQKHHPSLPLTSATLASPVATPKTVLTFHLHPVQRLRIGGARTPPLLYGLLAFTESINFPLLFPSTLCFFPAFCVAELVKNFPNINPLKSIGHKMYHQFNIHKFYVLPTQCIYVFCVDLRTNSD